MKKWIGLAVVFALGGFSGVEADQPSNGTKIDVSNDGRDWTPEDSIAIRYFVGNPATDPTPGTGAGLPPGIGSHDIDVPVVASPDGRHFFSVSFHGDLATDRIIYELDVYAVAEVRAALKHAHHSVGVQAVRQLVLSTAHSSPYYAAISLPRWDSNTVIRFHGADGDGPTRIFRYAIDSGVLAPLSDDGHDVLGPDPVTLNFASASGSSVFTALTPLQPWRPLDEYPMVAIKSGELGQFAQDSQSEHRLYASYQRGAVRDLGPLKAGAYGPWVSPDGRWAVVAYPPKGLAIPAAWNDYQVKPEYGYRFMLVDVEKGDARPILDAPVGTATAAGQGRERSFDAFWSKDSRHVVLFNTALPLDENTDKRQRMSYVIDYRVNEDRWTVLEPLVNAQGSKVQTGSWVKEGEELLLTESDKNGKRNGGTIFKFTGDAWVGRNSNVAVDSPTQTQRMKGLKVSLRQSANEPPRLAASEGTRETVISAPDPALAGVRRAPIEVFHWRDSRGQDIESQLMLPRNFSKEKQAPLVVQWGDPINPAKIFSPDGGVGTFYAAQALAAQGFIVLQVQESGFHRIENSLDPWAIDTPLAAPAQVRLLDEAVDMLKARGVIDNPLVGVIGWSHSGYQVYYMITHHGRVTPAAAADFDSVTYSYGEYVNDAGIGDLFNGAFENSYGGSFWRSKQGWLDAPSFNVDKVATPMLFSTTVAVMGALETVGAFRLNHKPFEYLKFSKGYHVLQRPRERIAAMHAVVDWMRFWLQGRDPGPEQGDRAARWRKIRTEWQQTQSQDAVAVGQPRP